MKNYQEVVNDLLKRGCEKTIASVKNANPKDMGNYVRVSITLDKDVPTIVEDEEGNPVEGKTNIIFNSTFTLGGILKSNEDASFIASKLQENGVALSTFMTGSKVTVISEKVNGGEIYHNPFTDKDTEKPLEHDTYIQHVVSVELGKTAMDIINKTKEAMANKLVEQALGL